MEIIYFPQANKENYLIALYFIVVNNNIYIVDAIHDK